MYVNAYWSPRRLLPSKCLGVRTAHGNTISLPLLLHRLLNSTGKGVLGPCTQSLSQEHLTRLERMPTAQVINNTMDASVYIL